MKSNALLICFLTLLSLSIYGQPTTKKADVFWGPEHKASKKATLSDIIGYDETGIYTIKSQRKGLAILNSTFTVEHYDNKMKLTKSVELNLETQGKNKELDFVIQLNGELYLFTSFENQKLKKKFLFVQSINRKNLRLNNDVTKIGEINFAGKSRHNSGSYHFDLSRDSSKVLIYYSLPFDRGEKERFTFHVYDNNLDELWSKDIELPYKDELFSVEDFAVDNNGNVQVIGMEFNEKRKTKRHGKPNYKYLVMSYYKQGEALEEYPVQVPGFFLTDMKVAVTDNGDIICGGFYSEEGTFSIIGSYFLKIDGETKQILTKSFKEFGIDFITQNLKPRKEEKEKKKAEKGKNVELYEYDLDNIILREDGGAVLVGEQFYIREHTTTTTDANGNTRFRTTYYYFYNDIIIISVNPDGEIYWNEKIAKKQISTNDGGFYSSYTMAIVKDKMYFVFNDNPKNLYYTGEGKVSNFNAGRESVVVLCELDWDGNFTREALFSSKDVEIVTRPKVCEQISETELILFGQKKKTHQFARVTFKH